MYLKELVTYEECKCFTDDFDINKYRDYLSQVTSGVNTILSDIGCDGDDFDTWYEDNIDDIRMRLCDNDLISFEPTDDEMSEVEDIIEELYDEMTEDG
jgi:hypothetical protein